MDKDKERKDISVFFNFTDVSFEKSDPLMSLVNAEQPLLYYDRLSVRGFSTKPEEWEEHVKALIFDMKNLLETRALSGKDRDGRIRLIIAFDLSKGILLPSEKDGLFFPAQNARYFKKLVKEAFTNTLFDDESRLSDRFVYCFIFLDGSNDQKNLPRLYRETAFDGYSSLENDSWITKSMVKTLDSPNISESIFDDILDNIGNFMDKAGVKDDFITIYDQKRATVKRGNYHKLVLSIITSLVGLGCEEFKDGVYFLLRIKNNPDKAKSKGEFIFKSLLQLLSTVDDRTFKSYFLPSPEMNTPWYYELDGIDTTIDDEIDKDAIIRFTALIEASKEIIGDLHKSDDALVTYKEYERNTQNPQDTDSHKPLNAKLSELRNEKVRHFLESRKVPFFFGKKVGDWDWYNRVLDSLNDIYQFEITNDRPLYDTPKRITNSEMTSINKECSYSELKEIKSRLEATPQPMTPTELYKQYQDVRKNSMNEFKESIDNLKKEMVKLGFLSRLLWITIISTIAFTLCFTYYYFYNGFDERPIGIAVCFLIAAFVFIFSSFIAQQSVKSKITTLYSTIDKIINDLQTRLQIFLNDVYERIKIQDEADIRKRNLDEIQSKFDELSSYNKKVELWGNHYNGINEKIFTILNCLNDDKDWDDYESAKNLNDINLEKENFKLSRFPYLPIQIQNEFNNMNTQLLRDGLSIENVTCFIKCFNFSRLPK